MDNGIRERKNYRLDSFMGVDYSTSPLAVHSSRATNMSNFINENGITKKRNGWNELFRFEDNARINGIWNFSTIGKDGIKYNFIIVHAGVKIYSLDLAKGVALCLTNAACDNSNIVDKRSYGVVNSGKLYILCGDYFVFYQKNDNSWALEKVYNGSQTYVPTTTISIDYDNAANRTTRVKDKPNMLSSRRKNTLHYNGKITDGNNIFTLDTKRIDNGKISIYGNGELSAINVGGQIVNDGIVTFKGNNGGSYEINVVPSIGRIEIKYAITVTDTTSDNVTVEFEYLPRDERGEKIANYSERITKCDIGAMFGLGGVDDRLFISGNERFPNICFHSEIDDLSYFPDVNTAACGNDGDAITAFSRLGDGTLALHKRGGKNDSNIYYRRGSTVRVPIETSTGVIYREDEIFPLTAGAIGEGVVSPWACANFSGDNIILSANGVYGVVLNNNVSTDERYARERSRLINERLLKHNLSEACAIVYKNRYYLSVENECYIADARYSFNAKGDMPGAYNYEWWHWDNIPARVWANINDELYFGTEIGSIAKFDATYIDKTYEKISGGKISVDLANNGFNVNAGELKKLTNGDRIKITSESGVYAEYILSGSLITGNKIKVNDTSGVVLMEDMEIYAYDVSPNCNIAKKTPYVMKNIDYGYKTFELYKNGQKVSIEGRDFKFCIKLKNREAEVANIDSADGSAFFQVGIIYGKTLKLIRPYTDETEDMAVKIFYRRNVIAEWTTPVMDLGVSTYCKNLHNISISSEPTVGGKIEFGYKTRTTKNIVTAQGVTTFSFDDIDFSDFSFELNSFATSYTKQLFVRNFNYIALRFASTNDRAAAVNNIGLEYSIIKKNKGVK